MQTLHYQRIQRQPLPRTITWTEPLISTSIKNVFIKSLSFQDLQEQLLLPVSAEKFSNPSTCEKLNQLTKEKDIQDIMNNTTVDTVNNLVSVHYLYNKNLPKLGENYYGATKRILTLHNKIYDKPEISAEIDKYMQEQIYNGNYIEIKVKESRKNNQLHFVGYNFVVSSTSSSTKVRMTTDSSMCTESGLSLNEVTQPAPGDIPSLRGILMHSRSHPFYAVYDIKKFFRSVRISNKDSFLRIVCVPSNSFSSSPVPHSTWIYYRDCAIPFGNSASGDYATCPKVAVVKTFIH